MDPSLPSPADEGAADPATIIHSGRDHASIIQALEDMGAHRIGHLYGSFEQHLLAVYGILREWRAPESVQLAGLFHAVYSTHGFATAMLDIAERPRLANLIGVEGERDAYLFCAVDRELTWPSIGLQSPVVFHDRFTRTSFQMGESELRHHCEILAANHVDFSRATTNRPAEQVRNVTALLDRLSPWLSDAAVECYRREVAGTDLPRGRH